ncbi:hypothetical protein ACFRAM_01390 [Paenibacillus sp. NPDC056722]|uniref:hypothetical protein n=1 Tax=Paenibacillus sp. NPDC056722 TaxID=3345924 RepID=UPI0036747190
MDFLLDIITSEKFYSGLIGISGSLIGGLFTLWGISWTLKRQEKDKELDKFPGRVSNLLELSIRASNMFIKFRELISVKQYDHDKRGEIENEIIDMLNTTYKLSSSIDNVTFEKADILYKEVRETLNKISRSLISGRSENTYTMVEEIKKNLMEFSEFAINRRTELTQQFSNKLKKSKRI